MNQQKSLFRISELLSRYKFQVSILNANAQLDINIISEDILIPILNIVFDGEFKNAKYSEDDAQFPAIDLLDENNRVAIQVTSSSDMKKVRKTLEGINDNKFYEKFDNFYIYIITQKQGSYSNTIIESVVKGNFTFSHKNILDEKDLYKKISSLEYESIVEIEKILEQQFADRYTETMLQNDLSNLIDEIRDKNNNQILALELEGNYEQLKVLMKKKNFFESKLIELSDPGQQFTLITEIDRIAVQLKNLNDIISKQLN